MSSFNPPEFDFESPPPRPTTPPVRRGFVLVLLVLSVAALLVYGVPYVVRRAGYAWEAGRSRAASEALAKLDKQGIVARASALFRMATTAVSPAVVNVHSYKGKRGADGFRGLPLGGDRMGPAFQSAELGSGVVIDKAKGYIVTNNHVVKDADQIMVRLGPGDDVPARLIGADAKSDLAVLQVKAALTAQAEWGDSDQLDNGDWVLAIGSPLGFDHSVTAGIVSATERNDVRINDYESFIQTDAAINPGNSGGPLIDLSGKVVGINTAIISQSGGYEGIGLAIPSSLAKRVVTGLIEQGKVVRGYLGVRLDPRELDTVSARHLNLPSNRGAVVLDVQPNSPAARAGLQRGDVIVNLARHDVVDRAGLRNLTASLDVGSNVPLTYYREGKPRTVTVTIDELPAAPEVLALGFAVQPRPAGPDGGGGPSLEIGDVVRGSAAFQAGLRPGMRILAVGEERVATVPQFEAAIHRVDLGQGLPLVVQAPDGRIGQVVVGGVRDTKQP